MVSETQRLCALLEAKRGMSTAEIVGEEIRLHKSSPQRQMQLEGERYYCNRSAVQGKKNDYPSRSNTKIEHSVLRKLVDQKVNYLLSKPFTVASKSSAYAKAVNGVLDERARAAVKTMGKEAIKKGIGWMQLYPDESGKLCLKHLHTEQIIPEWADEEHTKLDCVIRYYPQIAYEGRQKVVLTRAELWSAGGVERFVQRESGPFVPDVDLGEKECHLKVGGKPWNWAAPPFLWVKYCEEELPLLHFVKELIDDYNWQTSLSADLLRDVANCIFVLRNYGGEDLGQFVRELRQSLAIQVEADGGVDTVTPQLDMNAVSALLDRHRRDLYDLARSVDTQDPDLGNASGQALKFRYADLDMDCNELETEFRAMFGRMKPFLDTWFRLIGQGSFESEEFTVTFNRDIIVNETEAIQNVRNSVGLISEKTLVQNHPWVENAEAELEKLHKEEERQREELPFAFGQVSPKTQNDAQEDKEA